MPLFLLYGCAIIFVYDLQAVFGGNVRDLGNVITEWRHDFMRIGYTVNDQGTLIMEVSLTVANSNPPLNFWFCHK